MSVTEIYRSFRDINGNLNCTYCELGHLLSCLDGCAIDNQLDRIQWILQSLCNCVYWGVYESRVIIWTGDSRALIRVREDKVADVEVFRDVLRHNDSRYHTFSLPVEGLKPLRAALLALRDRKTEYTWLYYGNHNLIQSTEQSTGLNTASDDEGVPICDPVTGMWDFRTTKIPDLRARLKRIVSDSNFASDIVESLCLFTNWASLDGTIILWTGVSRALIMVKDQQVQIEVFPDFVHKDHLYYHVVFATVKDMKPLREALLERIQAQKEHAHRYGGNYYTESVIDVLKPEGSIP